MSTGRHAIIVLLGFSALVPFAPAIASDDIIVTAQWREEAIQSVPMSLQAFDRKALTDAGIRSPDDLVKVVPGFTFTPSSYGAPVYSIRGVGFYDTSLGSPPAVSLYMDEAPLPYSIIGRGLMFDLDRVEVLKGPQGTLYGQGTTGGAINLIAAKPSDRFELGGTISYGRFNAANAEGFVTGPIAQSLTARLAVSLRREDGWQRSYTRDDTLGRTELYAARASLEWAPSDRLNIRLTANGWMDRSDNQAGQLTAVTGIAARLPPALLRYPTGPMDPRSADWSPGQSYARDDSYGQVSLRSDYAFGFARLTTLTSFQYLDRGGRIDSDGTSLNNFQVSTPGNLSIFSQELRFSGQAAALQWVAGGNYQHELINDAANTDLPESSFPFDAVHARSRQKNSIWALFVDAGLALVPGLTAQAGVRYTQDSRRFEGCSYDSGAGDAAAYLAPIATMLSRRPITIAPGGCATLGPDFVPAIVRDRLSEDNLSWRAGLDWHPSETLMIYANAKRGNKPGAFGTVGATSYKQYLPARQESVVAYEAGWKWSAPQVGVQLNGAVFHYDYSDKQFRGKRVDPILGALNALINVPSSRVTGGEIELSGRWGGFSVHGGASYIDTRIEGPFDNYDGVGRPASLGGEPFPLAPDWQVSGGTEYEVRSGSLRPFVGLDVSHQGATNAGLGSLSLLRMPAYTLVDLRAGASWDDGRWRATAFVRNVGDEHYVTYVSTTSPDVAYRLTGRPRTFGIMLAYRQ